MTKKQRSLSKLKEQICDLELKRIMEMSDEEIMIEAIWEYGSPANAQKAINKLCDGVNKALSMHGIKPIKFQAATQLDHFSDSTVQEGK